MKAGIRALDASCDEAQGEDDATDGLVEIEVRIEPDIDEEVYDDAQDHTRCPDCKGSGWYTGLVEKRLCPTCDGSGWL